MPPLSPWPAWSRPRSMSAWRKSWATVRPPSSVSPASGVASVAPVAPVAERSSARAARAAYAAAGPSCGSATTAASTASVSGPGTSPIVSTTRARSASVHGPASTARRAMSTSLGAVLAQVSNVTWARVPVKPPSHTISVRRGRASTFTGAVASAHAACSLRWGSGSFRRTSSAAGAMTGSGTAAIAWTAAMAVSWSESSRIASRSRGTEFSGLSRQAAVTRSSNRSRAARIVRALRIRFSATATER